MAKLILTHDVSGLGGAGDIIEVKDGYARNFLVPQKFAVSWSRGGEKQVTQIKAAQTARALHSLEDAQNVKAQLESTKVRLLAKAGLGGRLFGSIKTSQIAEAIKVAGIGDLDKRKIEILSPIKALGEHQAKVSLRDGLSALITLQVVATK